MNMPISSFASGNSQSGFGRVALALLSAVIAFSIGCGKSDIDTTYGRLRASKGGRSINGTGVLGYMFQQAGHRVTSWRRLSPKLHNDRVIVWFPDSFDAPTDEETKFLQEWLAQGSNRTLVYVGRDYDAAATYWQEMAERVPPEQLRETRRRLAQSKADHDAARVGIERDDCSWFSIDMNQPRGPADSLSGPWSDGLDLEHARIETASHLEVPDSFEVQPLLESGDSLLVAELHVPHWGDSRVIVVANGSFLLNVPLVNHQHRQLAGRLIEACGPAGRTTFLESGPSGLPVLDDDPKGHTGFEAFTVWPIGAVLLHLTIVGIVFCCMVSPIFGRPRRLVEDAPTDFGKHVQALGELLAFSQDRDYALKRVQQYRQLMHEAGGTSTREPESPFETR